MCVSMHFQRSARNVGRILAGLLVFSLAACATSTSPTPQTEPSTHASPAISPVAQPTPRAEPSALHSASGGISYYSATKSAEGAHGGSPLLDLPRGIAVDYTVKGSCVFSVGLASATSAARLPSLTMTVTGPEVAGTWRLAIKPGSYYVAIGEAVGCIYSVNVRGDE